METDMKHLLLILVFVSFGFSQICSADDTYHGAGRTNYIAGGIVGTIVGFGIGHAIQHRYNEMGWIFTISDTVSVGAIIAGSLIGSPRPLGTFLWVSGVLLLVGFRVWQAIDLWVVPTGAMALNDPNDMKPDPLFGFRAASVQSNLVPQLGLRFNF